MIKNQENIYCYGPKQVASELNQAIHKDSLVGSTLDVNYTMVTISDWISPVIDLERTKANLVRNLIDNPKPSDAIYGASTRTIVFGDDISAAGLIENSPIVFTTDGTQYTVYVKTINQNTDTVVVIGQAVSNIDTSTTFADATLEAAGVEVSQIQEQETMFQKQP